MTKQGIRLMKDVYWDYISEPHLLIGGGTGGGKTVVLMTLVLALAKLGFIDLCDPKNADLARLKDVPVFKKKVFTSKEAIIKCCLLYTSHCICSFNKTESSFSNIIQIELNHSPLTDTFFL